MHLTAEPAFVLHARPWRETSLLVEVLTATHGRLGLVARGVQGPKRHVLRAALQPLQLIRLEAVLRGELARLISAEAVDVAPRLGGNAMLGAFYLNELTLRLAPRLDPVPELFVAYAAARALITVSAAFLMASAQAELPDPSRFGRAMEMGDIRAATRWLDEGLPPDFEADTVGSGMMIAATSGFMWPSRAKVIAVAL